MTEPFAALAKEDIARYSRQLLVKDFGVDAQKKLLESRVLVVGAGGLGCPVLLYLSGMGVGCLGIADGDRVELSNLHRQTLHSPADVGRLKVESARDAVLRRAPAISIEIFPTHIDCRNASDILSKFDLIVDASDNVATRYLVNDMCCILGKVLVSGSALGLEGQISVYNYKDGPCYRCCYPKPMPQSMAGSCADNGVLGVVPGIIGSLQAMEAVKVLTGMGKVLSGVQSSFDAWDLTFRHYKLPMKRTNCAVCGVAPSIKNAMDSVASIGPLVCEVQSPLDPSNILSVKEFHSQLDDHSSPESYALIDVREAVQFQICHLPHAQSIPLKEFSKPDVLDRLAQLQVPIYVICRRGMDSTHAVSHLVAHGRKENVFHIEEGLQGWSREIDPSFPRY